MSFSSIVVINHICVFCVPSQLIIVIAYLLAVD